MSNQVVQSNKLMGGIVATAGVNTNCWYQRETLDTFSINGAFSGLETALDWVMVKDINEKIFKSGVVRICGTKKSVIVNFKTPFANSDYFVFFTPCNNVKTFYVDKRNSRFVINGSFNIGSEISWVAIHKSLASMTGISNPGSIYSGHRTVTTPELTPILGKDSLDMTLNADSNLNGWYNNEMIIRPTVALDNINTPMNLDDYTVLLSSNANINNYWIEKLSDRVKIGTSYATECTINYMFIKSGINWWEEI